MEAKIELAVNGKRWIENNITKWSEIDQHTKQFKNGFVSTLSDTDTWEIAIRIFSRPRQYNKIKQRVNRKV